MPGTSNSCSVRRNTGEQDLTLESSAGWTPGERFPLLAIT
jgi:hypothetical protein